MATDLPSGCATPHPEGGDCSIGETSDRTGVPVATLRFYERRGLVHARRNDRNERRYSPAAIRRIETVRDARNSGIPIALLEVLYAHDSDESVCAAARSTVLDAIETRLTQACRLRQCLDDPCSPDREE